MIVLDRLLIGGIKFVLGKVAQAVDRELNDEDRLREELLALQMRFELGELSQGDFQAGEAVLLGRLRAIREEREGTEGMHGVSTGEMKVTGVEATFLGDRDEE
jgi:hypothetical protein